MNLNELKICISEIDTQKLEILKQLITSKRDILIIGNGGSNAIASHIAQDYTKVLRKKTLSFSDSSRLTCYMNDYGVDNAYSKFIEHFVEKNSLVILISSSGNSPNVINAAKYCDDNNIDFIILSGFSSDNKLNSYSAKSILDFWVNSNDYGIVEIIHEIILHSII